MKNVLISLLLGVLLATPASAFRLGKDCTCSLPQSKPAVLYSYNPSQRPDLNSLDKVFPVTSANPATAPVTPASPATKIGGSAKPVDDSQALHLVWALPKEYRTCGSCVMYDRYFRTNPEIAKLRQQGVIFHRFVDGDKTFSRAWHKVLPNVSSREGRAGEVMICLFQGQGRQGTVIWRKASPPLSGLADKLKSLVGDVHNGRLRDKLCDRLCPKCPKPAPAPEPEPEDDLFPLDEPLDAVPPVLDKVDLPLGGEVVSTPPVLALLGLVALAGVGAAVVRYANQ